MANQQSQHRAGSRTYLLKFTNSRTGQVHILHPAGAYKWVNTQLDAYQNTWATIKNADETIRRTRTFVEFIRKDELGEYKLKVAYVQNKGGL